MSFRATAVKLRVIIYIYIIIIYIYIMFAAGLQAMVDEAHPF